VVTVPTTAGTGSEVETGAVITDENTQTRDHHPSEDAAGIVIGAPRSRLAATHLTAATGMDALSHCLEAYACPTTDPMATHGARGPCV